MKSGWKKNDGMAGELVRRKKSRGNEDEESYEAQLSPVLFDGKLLNSTLSFEK